MTPPLSKPSGAAPTSLFYITFGAIMTIWSGIWYFYLANHPPAHGFINYICFGFVITGIVLLLIGFALGPIARMSRTAELPPVEASGNAVSPERPGASQRLA